MCLSAAACFEVLQCYSHRCRAGPIGFRTQDLAMAEATCTGEGSTCFTYGRKVWRVCQHCERSDELVNSKWGLCGPCFVIPGAGRERPADIILCKKKACMQKIEDIKTARGNSDHGSGMAAQSGQPQLFLHDLPQPPPPPRVVRPAKDEDEQPPPPPGRTAMVPQCAEHPQIDQTAEIQSLKDRVKVLEATVNVLTSNFAELETRMNRS